MKKQVLKSDFLQLEYLTTSLRITGLSIAGRPNLLADLSHISPTPTPYGDYHFIGGHRLWHAPEAMPPTYAPDNGPVKYSWDGKTLKLVQPVESTTGIAKEIEITLDPASDHVTLLHRLVNKNLWTVELAPWALTVMAPGGRAVFPHEPYCPHPEYLAPAGRWRSGITRI